MDKILPQRMQNVGAWAERQVNRAVMFIRTASMSITGGEEDEGTEINQVQASDGYFFEQFIQTPTVEEDSTANDGQLTIVRLTINENQQALDNLYVEALYTIVHKVGNTTAIPEHQLIEYVKTAFQIEDSRHLKLIDRARKEKPPVMLLNVHLLEARDLIAKDINGFSDPFTMMGVIPGRRRKESRARNSSGDKTPPEDPSIDGQPSSPSAVSKTSTVTAPARPPSKLFKNTPEFCIDSVVRFEENWVRKKGTTSEMKGIPAKLIKASSVQRKTLFPKWNEKFQFIVEDVAADRFHLDIWDHDDEESSVLDAVTSLNQISGLKGLGRYFKEDIPSTGTEEWFTLEKRSEKSEVSGQVLLRLWLSTKEERVNDQEDDLLDVKQHIELIRQFALQEIRFSGAPVSFYHGDLPETAKMILHQHAVQGDLTEVHQNMCQWLAYSAMTNISISYAFLYEILQNLIAKWVPLALDKEEENMLADSFQRFDEHCHEQLIKHRTNINVEKRVQLEFFGDMIRCLKLMRNSAIYQKTMPAARYFEQDIVDCLTNACEELYNLLLGLNAACAKSTHFEPIFRSNADVEYAVPMYQVFDRMLYEYIAAEMMNEKQYKMDAIEWDPMFDRAIAKWFDLARVKGFARVDLACQLDAQVQISSNEFRHTSSYIDVCHIIDQIMTTWERMTVKDVYTQVDLTEKIVQTVCKIAEYYVDRIMAQLAADGFCGQLNPVLPPALVNIIDCTVERMVQRQVPQMKKHVFHLAWSPGACPVDQSLKPLTDMLDTELSSIHRNLLHRNFIRIMHGQVNVLVRLLQDCVNENPGLEPPFYMRLSEAWNVLVEFFHAGGKGISMEAFASMPSHRALVSQLTLNQLSTVKLIEQYYLDLLKTQSEVSECKYGILNVRAYYNSNSQTLNMDVIGAKQVIPLDSNGLSDPFVVIEVVPRIRFPLLSTAKTKVVSKCLNPIFDETHIAPKLPPCALVHFVVMDHDMFRSNDFAGEAFLDLTEVPGFGTAGVSNTLRQFNLVLIHSSNKGNQKKKISNLRLRSQRFGSFG
ncbi:Protein unc-13-like protein D [Aphelenchoides besseyi]|nr:Protein unc-13-like protein D [Aphelenchoides besseyi]